jgi:hypothetical protein
MSKAPSTPPSASRAGKSASAPQGAKRATDKTSPNAGTRLSQRYVKQKATFQGKREDRPVIFGLGRGLSAAQRARLQRRLYFTFAGVMAFAVLFTIGFGIFNVKVLQPRQPIVTVNGVQIPQYVYRNMVAYLAQDTWNKLESDQRQLSTLQAQASQNPQNQSQLQSQITTLQGNISSLQTAFTQTQVDQLAIDDLVEDQLIQQATPGFEHSDHNAAKVLAVTTQQINTAFNAFKAAFPAGESYGQFKSQDGLSDQDVKNAIAVVLRRNAMDTYQRSLYVSPAKEVHIARIQFNSKTLAQQDLADLQKNPNDWDKLAKRDSIDSSTASSGGDLGSVFFGQQDQGIERWAFSAKAGQISPVITDVGGTFDIVKVIAINPSATVPADTLSGLQGNALSHWLTGQRDLAPTNHISSVNQTMQNSADNLPPLPSFNVTFSPTATPTTAGG